jgi:hypothetical protein
MFMNTIECSKLSCSCPPEAAYARILHAVPDAPAVDVYVNGNLIAKHLPYKQFTDYFLVSPGEYRIEVFTTGKRESLAASACLHICPCSAVTIAVNGVLCDVGLIAIPEVYDVNRQIRRPRKAYFRSVNLSPNAPPLDITLTDGVRLFRNVRYKAHTRYIILDPGTYTLQVKPAGSNQMGLTVPNVVLERGRAYSIYAVGLVGGEPPLEAIMVQDGDY